MIIIGRISGDLFSEGIDNTVQLYLYNKDVI